MRRRSLVFGARGLTGARGGGAGIGAGGGDELENSDLGSMACRCGCSGGSRGRIL